MKKLFVALLLIAFSLFLLAGCGKSNEPNSNNEDSEEDYVEDEDYEDDYDDNDDYDDTDEESYDDTSGDNSDNITSITDQYVLYEGAQDILKYFKEFGYVYNTKNPDSEPSSWSFDYEVLGTETVDGVEAEHIKVTMVENNETKVTEGWYNDNWEALKIINNNGEEKTGLDASFEGGILTMYTQLYCTSLALNLSIYSEDGTLDDFLYEHSSNSNEAIDVGNGSMDMDITEITIKMGDYNRRFGSIPVDGKKFIVLIETYGKEIDALDGLKVTRAIVR